MNRRQFERVIEEHRPRLLKVAENLVGAAAAPDVVQAAFENVLRGGQWKTEVRNVRSWLTTSVQNAAKDLLKADDRRGDHEAAFAALLPLDESERDDAIDVRRAVASLPEEIRAALIAVIVEGVTEREHAEEVRVSQPVVHKRVQRGLALLRQGLSNAASASSQEASGGRDGA